MCEPQSQPSPASAQNCSDLPTNSKRSCANSGITSLNGRVKCLTQNAMHLDSEEIKKGKRNWRNSSQVMRQEAGGQLMSSRCELIVLKRNLRQLDTSMQQTAKAQQASLKRCGRTITLFWTTTSKR